MRKRFLFPLIAVAIVAMVSVLVAVPASSEGDPAVLFTEVSLDVPAATLCYEGKELVDGVMLDKQCMCSAGGICVCCWWEGWWRVICSREGACGPDNPHQDCQKEPY